MNRMIKDSAGRFTVHVHPNICQIHECFKHVHGTELCQKHYMRLRRYGDPLIRKKRANGEGTIYHGYKLIHVKGKRIFEHRHIMEQNLGRPLSKSEIVHHKDENKRNNTIENLQVLLRTDHPFHHPNVLHNLSFGPKSPKRTYRGLIS